MTVTPQPERLPGVARHFFSVGGYAELWLGPTELYYLTGSTFAEHHMRFLLRDIQAIAQAETKRYTYMAAVLAGAMFLSLLVGYGVIGGDEGLFFLFSLFVPVILFPALAIHLVLGPTCIVTLHTRAHRVRLLCLRRKRTADRAIERLRAAIERNQARHGDGLAPTPSVSDSLPEPSAPEA